MTQKAMHRWLTVASLSFVLAACSSDQRDLQAYIDEVKARPGGAIEPLPEVLPPPSFAYVPGERRSPFVPDVPQSTVAGNNIGPDPNRARETLEREPLDSLTMVGTIRDAGGNYGLIQDATGLIHRVTTGNHMGQNFGRITSVTESEIELVEIMSDGRGGYYERPARIALQ